MHPVVRIKGTVVKGFGRGSKQLGIPTANVDPDSLRTVLAEAVTGWAGRMRCCTWAVQRLICHTQCHSCRNFCGLGGSWALAQAVQDGLQHRLQSSVWQPGREAAPGWAQLVNELPHCKLPPLTHLQSKTCEPWLLHDFGGEDFCGSEIRLIICAYIRPEASAPMHPTSRSLPRWYTSGPAMS